jgi:PAS domain S-box-containing protein
MRNDNGVQRQTTNGKAGSIQLDKELETLKRQLKWARESQALAIEILVLLNRPLPPRVVIREILGMIQDFSGFEAVGIRLREGEDFPYFETKGFPSHFVEAESSLCVRTESGQIMQDSAGNPVLECMCGNVICGRTDPSLPFFTPGGSFWSNSTTELLASTTEEERQSRTRNRCNGQGYESVALIPLRSGREIVGLLQLNDSRKNCFTLDKINFFEGIGLSIGIVFEHKRLEEERDRLSNLSRDMLEQRVEERTAALKEANEKLLLENSERRRAEEALRENEERYRAIFNNAAVGIYLSDSEGRLLQVNSKAASMYGYSEEELHGLTFFDITHPDEREAAWQRLISLRQGTKDSYRVEIRYVRKDGEVIWADLSVSALRGPQGEYKATLAVVVDITERKKSEQQGENLKEQLLQAQKMEAIGTLAGGIAHDFNNMLTIILGYSDILLADMDEQDPRAADLEKIIQTAKNGAELVQRLLMFSRRTQSESRPLRLNVQIEQTRKLLERTLPKMIDIRFELEDDLPLINADPVQIDQILMNLAINARDAMPDGGRLVIETKNATVDEHFRSSHGGLRLGNYVMLSVSDTGHGIDEATRARIFDPFFTTKGRGSAKGTGLGLTVVHSLVDQHGGYMFCDSEPGKGSRFSIYFPTIEAETSTGNSIETQLPEGRGETILLVDDEEFVRDLGERILKRAGYKVITAANGREALEVYARDQGEIKLVILDLLMPEMGGQRCLHELLKIRTHPKVLVASGQSGDPSIEESLEMGAKGFVSKPFTLSQLLHQVRKILDEP